MTVTLKDLLLEMSDTEKPVKYSELLLLSGLTPEEVVEFRVAWPAVPQDRNMEIMGKLIELSEDNLELDFSAIFMSCLEDKDPGVRERAAKGLWDCDDRSVIRPLIGLMVDDPASTVRAAACMSLRRFATLAREGKLMSRDAQRIKDALMAVINRQGEDIEVRRRAIEAVASFDVPEIDEIIRDAYHSGDIKLKQSSIYAMGQSGNTKWLPTILDEMHHELPEIRYECACAFGLIGEEATVPHLIRLVQDTDAQVQLASIQSLGEIGGPLAKQALLRCAKLGDDTLEEAAKTALKELEFDDDPLGFRFDSQ
ncbi:MAG: HEAT repeat domain-containing protein [SAR202 cluster bacterium]|nr:HEAT repeat domain-containing protein [SAR202 cluster bacterium]